METISNIFNQNTFSVAVCIVLFYVLWIIFKSEMKQNNEAMRIVKEANDKHLEYLQTQNQKLTSIISECTKALNDNTKVFNDLMTIMSAFRKYLQEK